MRTRIVEFNSELGRVRVEVEDAEQRGPQAVGRAGEVAEQAAESFESAIAGVQPITEAILSQLSGLSAKPEAVEVSFGIKLSGKLGVVLASSTAEAHCAIKLSWKSSP